MRIKSLNKYEPKVIEGILSDIALSMLPDPGITKKELKSIDPLILSNVIQELRQKLNLQSTDNSPDAMAKIYNLISTKMSEIAFANKDVSKVKERLGQQGDLRPDLYVIEFSKAYEDVCSKFSIRRSHVEEVLRSPDYIEHLLPEKVGLSSDNAASFYFKTIDVKNGKDEHSLIVITSRAGYKQKVMLAWKLYHEDVDLSGATTPIEIFKRFLDVYGLDVKCGQLKSKFIYYEKVSPDPERKDTAICTFSTPNEKTKVLQNFILTTSKEKGIVAVKMAFAVNLTKYFEDLKKHGVKVDPSVLED